MSQEVRGSDILHILHVDVSTVSEEKFDNLKTDEDGESQCFIFILSPNSPPV